MRALADWVEHLLADNGETEAAASVMAEALGSPEDVLRDKAAELLIDAISRGRPGPRARIFHLLQASWWPPSPGLAHRAHAATLQLLPLVDEEGPEIDDAMLLWSHLGRADPSLLRWIVAGLESEVWGIRRASAGALGRLGDAAVPCLPQLVKALDDPDERVASVALESLSALAPMDVQASLPALRAELRNRQGARRFLALTALRALMEDAVHTGSLLPAEAESLEPALLSALADEGEAVRMQAAGVLGLRGEPSGPIEAALRGALSDPSRDVGAAAAVALLRLERPLPEALKLLQDQLCGQTPEDHEAAFTALEPLEPAALARARSALEAAAGADEPSVKEGARALLSRLA